MLVAALTVVGEGALEAAGGRGGGAGRGGDTGSCGGWEGR